MERDRPEGLSFWQGCQALTDPESVKQCQGPLPDPGTGQAVIFSVSTQPHRECDMSPGCRITTSLAQLGEPDMSMQIGARMELEGPLGSATSLGVTQTSCVCILIH